LATEGGMLSVRFSRAKLRSAVTIRAGRGHRGAAVPVAVAVGAAHEHGASDASR